LAEKKSLVEAIDLSVRYPTGDLALYDVNFEIDEPSFTAIIGPNGSGKSTLLRTALGLLQPSKGSLRILGYDSRKQKQQIRKLVRYMPQRDSIDLSVPMRVKDIVLMGALLKKAPPRIASSKDRESAREVLEKVDMLEYWNHPFPQLSGGQRQRVLLARVLASKGSLLILDEPLAGTDAHSQDLIVEVLGEYGQEHDVSIIMVTHDLNPIHLLVKDVLLMKNTVVGKGTPCDIMDPKLLKQVYGPTARIVEYGGHRYCVTHDSGVDRHE
jgi:ABC-type Mn2+/Zn2+ transport system ATPase subunit